MRSCPFCNEENKDNNKFCAKCGNKLPKEEKLPSPSPKGKISGFKIFIILIISIVVLSIVVLSVLYIFTDYLRVRGATISKESQDQYLQNGEDIELSEGKERVTSLFGYPDEFVIVFDQSSEYKRAETWLFEEMEASFTFLDGKYNASDKVITAKLENDNYNVKPGDFKADMSPDEINDLIGEIGIEEIDPEKNLKVLTFGEGIITCTFDSDDSLIIVSRMRRVLQDEGQ